MKRAILLVSLALVVTGCVTLTPGQKELFDELVAKGEPIHKYPDPELSAWLSLLPGGGQFANGQVLFGILNFFTWPLSIAWGMPAAMKDAETIRKIYSVKRYLDKKGEESPPWDSSERGVYAWDTQERDSRRGRRLGEPEVDDSLLSYEEIERRRRRWSDGRARRWELSRRELQQRRSQYREAMRHEIVKRRIAYRKDRLRFDKRTHVAFGLNLLVGDPFLGSGMSSRTLGFGVGGHIGALHSFTGAVDLLVGGDFRFDYVTNGNASKTMDAYQGSIGPIVGFEKRIPYLFLRPGLCYGGVFFERGYRRVDDASLGFCLGVGFGLRFGHGGGLRFFGNYFWPAKPYRVQWTNNPTDGSVYAHAFVFSVGLSLRF